MSGHCQTPWRRPIPMWSGNSYFAQNAGHLDRLPIGESSHTLAFQEPVMPRQVDVNEVDLAVPLFGMCFALARTVRRGGVAAISLSAFCIRNSVQIFCTQGAVATALRRVSTKVLSMFVWERSRARPSRRQRTTA